MKDLMMDLWDPRGMIAVLLNGIFAAMAWTWKYSTVHFASLASEFVAKEILPWVTLVAVITTTILAWCNYCEKRIARINKQLDKEETDSP